MFLVLPALRKKGSVLCNSMISKSIENSRCTRFGDTTRYVGRASRGIQAGLPSPYISPIPLPIWGIIKLSFDAIALGACYDTAHDTRCLD